MSTVTKPTRADVPNVRQTGILIGDEFRPSVSGKTFETINPATEEVICEVAEGDAADVDLAVHAARAAFETGPWSRMDARDRGRLLNRLADLVEQNLEELAALEKMKVTVVFNAGIDRLNGEEDQLTGVAWVDLDTRESTTIPAGTLIMAAGRFPEMLFTRTQLESEGQEAGAASEGPLIWSAFPPYKHADASRDIGLFAPGDASRFQFRAHFGFSLAFHQRFSLGEEVGKQNRVMLAQRILALRRG